jgi:hypothetical protein
VPVVEDAERQHGFQVLGLDLIPLSSCMPEVQSLLSYKVPTCVAEKDEDGFAVRNPIYQVLVV